MNTFALILLGWPLFLAINGKLVEFVTLATGKVLTPPHEGQRSGLLPGAPGYVAPKPLTPVAPLDATGTASMTGKGS